MTASFLARARREITATLSGVADVIGLVSDVGGALIELAGIRRPRPEAPVATASSSPVAAARIGGARAHLGFRASLGLRPPTGRGLAHRPHCGAAHGRRTSGPPRAARAAPAQKLRN